MFQDRLPTSDGTTSNWSAINFGSKYVEVDEAIGSPDEDASYIYRNSTGTVLQDFGFTAFDIPDGVTVTKVNVTIRAKFTAGIAPNIAGILHFAGIHFAATNQVPTSSYADYVFEWTTSPNTGIDWTVAEVEGIPEFGVRRTGGNGSTNIRVTQAYVSVEYTEASLASFGMMQFFQGL